MPFFSKKNQLFPSNQVPTQKPQSQSQQKRQSQHVYPWSAHTSLSRSSLSPLSRHGHTLSATATLAGEMLLFGGYVPSSESPSNGLYAFSTRDFSITLLKTSGQAPNPRCGHRAAFTSTTLVIWGGVTSFSENKCHDDSLYFLNLVSREWTRVEVNGPGPGRRSYHTVTLVGSKLFVFGGQITGRCINDIWAFDLNSVTSNPLWESYEPIPGNEKPPPRSSHVSATTGDRIIISGGSDGSHYFNDTWSFNISTREWTELQCTGSVPSPRADHAAVLVDDVMYVFGGRAPDRTRYGDLTALNLSTQRWIAFQDIGSGPHGRSSHAMASDGTRIFVLGGKLSAGARAKESKLTYVLDTKRITFPDPVPNTVNLSEKAALLARDSSASSSTQGRSQPTFSSSDSDAHAENGASSFQRATSEDLDHPASLQIGREESLGSNDLSSLLLGMNVKTRHVLEEDDDSEGSTEHHGMIVMADACSEKGVSQLEHERVTDLERPLSKTHAAQTGRDREIAQLIEQLAQKSALLEQAEANAAQVAESKKRAGRELHELQTKLDEMVLSRDKALEQIQSALRKATSRAAEANERSKRELAEVHAKLEAREYELAAVRSRLTDTENGWAKTKAESAQSALQKATSRADEANERSQCACEQIGDYETKLAEVRAELEEKKLELEVVRLQLTDANDGWSKSNAKAEKLCAQKTAGPANSNEDGVTGGIMERMRAMEAQIASLRWSEKSFEMMECRNEG